MNRILWTTGIITAIAAVAIGILSVERTIAMSETSSRIDQMKKKLDEGVPRYPGSDPEGDMITRIENIESNFDFYASIKFARDLLALAMLPLVVVSAGSFVVVRKRNNGQIVREDLR